MNVADPAALAARYARNLPRYTSYPTAAQFTDAVGPDDARDWLRAVPAGDALSLYLHVPFCDTLCRFCGCNTAVLRSADALAAYAALLIEELRRITRQLGTGHSLSHLQWGGGTPTTLPVGTLRQVMQTIRNSFTLLPDAEISIEIDPRHLPAHYPAVLHELGFNRASLGVQDINPAVQEACGRIQSLEQTTACIDALRGAGIDSINIDLIYGLPRQNVQGVRDTATAIAALSPDRLAVFGYAHVPWKQKRQNLMPTGELPDAIARFEQRAAINDALCAAGYLPVGLDHYSRPDDRMGIAARDGTLHRNFQGYTTDPATVLIGVGASAISSYPQGMTQNAVSSAAYARLMGETPDSLPVVRVVRRTMDDRLRAQVIERLMCDMDIDLDAFTTRHGLPQDSFDDDMRKLSGLEADGFVIISGRRLRVTEEGRAFLRHVAAAFDRHLDMDMPQRHASGV
ncbi:oxygen-independent coproporphyrinogen III oxidase [Gluconacetobacter entanii]|uniref:Coproporphyrinogen-III oxidase n=1 Tax=Gluconacetobacter entanii TaxID=108528 RepID=A0A318PW40_9PROT|nr:oxygen-independent coproporphyrinogen III oxidase [Gluconacetobacter entanii]PYD63388.1 oxygen-independent coproporphyrinogen III oxidase [Gluconacetobacter entanii]